MCIYIYKYTYTHTYILLLYIRIFKILETENEIGGVARVV